ncbi:MAG: hypothetical protein AABW89_04780 [Nanoarchaeota archaeon]
MPVLKSKFILEILGRPAEHLEKSLSELVDKMGSDKGLSIIHKEIHKPKKVEKADNLWTTFADIDLSFESLPIFFNAIMTYLPAHIEVYEPDLFKINAFELNEFANFVVSRLHNYDALAKRMMSEREILINKLEFLRNGGDPKVVFAPQNQQSEQLEQVNKPSVNKSEGAVENKKKKKIKKK